MDHKNRLLRLVYEQEERKNKKKSHKKLKGEKGLHELYECVLHIA